MFFHLQVQVRVWSRTKSSRDKFAAETGARACDTVEAATKGADIICTCTNSAEPVLFAEHVKDGAHVNGWLYKIRSFYNSAPVVLPAAAR